MLMSPQASRVSDKNNVTVGEEVTEKRLIIRNESGVKKAEPLKRKGIKGFFDRVFKKKDKK